MSKYKIQLSKKVNNTKIPLYKLLINERCNIDLFDKQIKEEGRHVEDLQSTYSIIEKACNLIMLPKGMFRVIQAGNLPFQIYEAKRGVIRIYMIKLEKTGKIILAGGMKDDQESDIKSLKKLVKDIKIEGISDPE